MLFSFFFPPFFPFLFFLVPMIACLCDLICLLVLSCCLIIEVSVNLKIGYCIVNSLPSYLLIVPFSLVPNFFSLFFFFFAFFFFNYKTFYGKGQGN